MQYRQLYYYGVDGSDLTEQGKYARYFDVGEVGYPGNFDDRAPTLVADHVSEEPRLRRRGRCRPQQGRRVSRLIIDSAFTSTESYQAALHSEAFKKVNMRRYWSLRRS
jgi:hypothetical protein